MARIRSMKPELRTSLVVAAWPREVRYFFTLLWGYLDDHGYGVDDARLMKADCLPLDDDVTAAVVEEWVALVVDSGPLCRYEASGKRYVHAVNWDEHQRPSHPAKPRFPKCPEHDATPAGHAPESLATTSGGPPEGLAPEQGAGSREQGGEQVQPPSSEPAPPADTLTEVARSDVEQVCRHLADCIEANGSKRPTVTKAWRSAARLLLDRDGRTVEQIKTAIDWCQADDFWRANVLSMPKLREKYDQLRLAAQRSRAPAAMNGRPTDDPDYWDRQMAKAAAREAQGA